MNAQLRSARTTPKEQCSGKQRAKCDLAVQQVAGRPEPEDQRAGEPHGHENDPTGRPQLAARGDPEAEHAAEHEPYDRRTHSCSLLQHPASRAPRASSGRPRGTRTGWPPRPSSYSPRNSRGTSRARGGRSASRRGARASPERRRPGRGARLSRAPTLPERRVDERRRRAGAAIIRGRRASPRSRRVVS